MVTGDGPLGGPLAVGETVIVTGGAGFIGAALSSGLVDAYNRVVVVDNLSPQVHACGERPALLDPRVELVVGDVREPGVWESVLSECRPDVVVHLAAETGTGQSLTEASLHADVNVVGLARMLDALQRRSALPHRVVLASGRAVYGEARGATPSQETSSTRVSAPARCSVRRRGTSLALSRLRCRRARSLPHP